MTNTLVGPTDLAAFPGAPFDPAMVDAAAQVIRDEVGWHLAPVQSETLLVSHGGGKRLLLPTREIGSVSEVRDVSGSAPVVLSGWRVLSMGALERDSWPVGEDVVEVDLSHGHAATPANVIGLAARLAQSTSVDRTVTQESAQPFQVMRTRLAELRADDDANPSLDRYTARV